MSSEESTTTATAAEATSAANSDPVNPLTVEVAKRGNFNHFISASNPERNGEKVEFKNSFFPLFVFSGLGNLGWSTLADGHVLLDMSLQGKDLDDVSVLKKFPNLQNVDLSANNLKEVKCLSALRALRSLRVANNELEHFLDFDEWSGNDQLNTSLHHVDYKNNNVGDLDRLLKHNYIRSALYSILSSFQQRKAFLEIYTNKNRLLFCRTVDVTNNKLATLDHISSQKYLQDLRASGNQVASLAPIDNPSLCFLDISENALFTLSDFKPQPELRHLDVSGNKIASLKGADTQTKLSSLLASNNSVASMDEVKRLASLSQLRRLDLRDNPVSLLPEFQRQVLYILPRLEELNGVEVLTNTSRRGGLIIYSLLSDFTEFFFPLQITRYFPPLPLHSHSTLRHLLTDQCAGRGGGRKFPQRTSSSQAGLPGGTFAQRKAHAPAGRAGGSGLRARYLVERGAAGK